MTSVQVIERFDGTGDFSMWKRRMLSHIRTSGLKEAILSDDLYVTQENTKDNDNQDGEKDSSKEKVRELDPKKVDKSEKAMDMIIINISNQVLRKIGHCETAYAMWNALDKLYMESLLPDRIYLQLRFYSFKMDEKKSVDENVDEFLKLVSDLINIGVVLTEESQAVILLRSLPSCFDHLKDTLKYGRAILSLREVIASAKSKERELRESGKLSRNVSEGLIIQSNRGRSDKKKDKKGRNRSKSRGRNQSRSRNGKNSRDKSETGCFQCGNEGHWKRDCPERRNKGSSGSSSNNVNIAKKDDDYLVLTASSQDVKDEWVLDSGCTFHITPNKDLLSDFREIDGGKVYMGNNSHSEVKGMGSIKIENTDKSVIVLTDVRYMPTMTRNLISYGMLEKAGCTYSGENYRVNFYKNSKKVISGRYCNGLYFLEGKVLRPEVNIVQSNQSSTSKWHRRLAHMSLQGMKILAKRGILPEKEVKELDFCEDCVLGKSHKQSFGKGQHTSKGILDYIHSDLWGSPSTPPSLGDCKYFLTFIDDYSRKVWIYFLRSKDEAFSRFKEWKTEVENQKGKRVKSLRTDNGLEFCNNLFDELCRNTGVIRHKTCPYTPQQNGVSERMNRTIMEKVRCLLSETGLEQKFWAETACTVVYLINRAPNSAVDFKQPEEIWSGNKPNLDHIRRFGCVAYVHTIQGKTEPRAVKGYFIGYPKGVKGYKVWLPEDQKVVISRNVVFNEEVVYKEELKFKDAEQIARKRVHFNQVLVQPGTTDDKHAEQTEGTSERVEDNQPEEQAEGNSEEEEEAQSTNNTNLDDYLLARDRTRRQIKPPSRFNEDSFVAYALAGAASVDLTEPQNYLEAKNGAEWNSWKGGMIEEMESLLKNHTWDIVDRPKDKKVIGSKWIFTKKTGQTGGENIRFKARLVAKGFSQVEGIDYEEVFAPVVKHVSIRIILSLVVYQDMELEQMDVKTAFLHGNLEEEIFMEQPEGFEVKGKEKQVCLLRKSLYGLKQSPRQWNKRFNSFMLGQGFLRSNYDQCVYTQGEGRDQVFLLIYVDDMLIASKSKEVINRLKGQLSEEFEMKDLGAADKILGMQIIRDRKNGVLKLSQEKYLSQVLQTFNMQDCKPVTAPIGSQFKLRSLTQQEAESEAKEMEDVSYASATGSLMYAMVGSRPDLAYGVGLVSRFMGNPGKMHWQAVKWILRYLKGSLSNCLTFNKRDNFNIIGYVDADYAGDLDKRRSITGYVFQVGGNTVSWRSSLQRIVALSTTESEYVALTEAIKEAIWLKGFCSELNLTNENAKVYCDSQSAICLAKNSTFHERTKHIDIKMHFIRDIIESKQVLVEKIHTSQNAADILTKVLPGPRVETGLSQLRVI